MLQLHDQHVLVLGLGASGLAMARWCAQAGAHVTVADTREVPPGLEALRSEFPAARFVAGAFSAALVEGQPVRAVFKSPGLAPADVAPVLEAAHRAGLWTGGEVNLFADTLGALRVERAYAPKVIAITGTNGKTTVTSLTGQLMDRAGKSFAVAGNIGPTLLDTLAARIASQDLPEVWVLELSSFQLDATHLNAPPLEPTVGCVLNVTQDHLDWHGDMAAYAGAKARVFGQQALMLLNREDPLVMAMLPATVKNRPSRTFATFGGDMPQRPGDFGIETVNGMPWLVRALEADETRKRRKDEPEELFFQRLMPADALRIRGRHNAVNALAALALATAVGCTLGPMLYGLRDYRGEPHRVESVGVVNGIEYFDDSKGTNVGATVAALKGLGQAAGELPAGNLGRKLVVILGGEGKGQDFTPLADPVTRHARAVVLIGRDAAAIRAALAEAGVPLLDAGSMTEAVTMAAAQARNGDAVLMSPACASFDMFKNYGHRAEVFRAAVQAMATEAGVDLEAQA
jgi:UDP-N-acetylmuramoylalanine--D-glutamate ligase